MKAKNSSGPSTVHWGTPESSSFCENFGPSRTTKKILDPGQCIRGFRSNPVCGGAVYIPACLEFAGYVFDG